MHFCDQRDTKYKIQVVLLNAVNAVSRSYSGPHFPGFSRILSEYLSVFSPNAGKSRKNADQNNSEYGLFLRRGNYLSRVDK